MENYFKAIFVYIFNDPHDPTKPSWDTREHVRELLVKADDLESARKYAQRFEEACEVGLTFVNKRNTKLSLRDVVEPTEEELQRFLMTEHILNRYEELLPQPQT